MLLCAEIICIQCGSLKRQEQDDQNPQLEEMLAFGVDYSLFIIETEWQSVTSIHLSFACS